MIAKNIIIYRAIPEKDGFQRFVKMALSFYKIPGRKK